MPQVVGPGGQGRSYLLRRERQDAGLSPDVADSGGGDDLAAFASSCPVPSGAPHSAPHCIAELAWVADYSADGSG